MRSRPRPPPATEGRTHRASGIDRTASDLARRPRTATHTLREDVERRREALLRRRGEDVRPLGALEARVRRDGAAARRREPEAVPIVDVGLDRMLQSEPEAPEGTTRLLIRRIHALEPAKDALATLDDARDPVRS